MRIKTGLFIFIVMMCPSIVAQAAGNDTWENKFLQTLPTAQQAEMNAVEPEKNLKLSLSSVAQQDFKDTNKTAIHWAWPTTRATEWRRVINKPTADSRNLQINIIPASDII